MDHFSEDKSYELRYPCVVDLTATDLAAEIKSSYPRLWADKPFGVLYHYDESLLSNITQETITGPVLPLRAHALEAIERAPFEPVDEIRADIVVNLHYSQPSQISLNVTIPADQCPATMDHTNIGKELTVGFTCVAKNVPNEITIDEVYRYDGIHSNCTMNEAEIPLIVRTTYGALFYEIQEQVRLMILTIDNANQKIKQDSLLNDHVWGGSAQRAVIALQKLITAQGPTQVKIWVLTDDFNCPVIRVIRRLNTQFIADRSETTAWKRMYSKDLSARDEKVSFNHESFKPLGNRPAVETNAVYGYHDQMEMSTRLALSSLQIKDDRARNPQKLCVVEGVIRPLELLEDVDLSYLALLKVNPIKETEAWLSLRFEAGEVLQLNLRLDSEEMINDENWYFTIANPFPWNQEGEITGHLFRSHEKLPTNATDDERKEGYEFLNTKLPVKPFDVYDLSQVRVAIDSAQPVRVAITFLPSYDSEDRSIAAQDILLNGSRPDHPRHKTTPTDQYRRQSISVKRWGAFLLMRDCRSGDRLDLLPQPASKAYMANYFKDADQVSCANYLYNCPTTFTRLAIGVIKGFPGSGKTTFAAGFIVAKLLGSPSTKVVFCASSNQAVDVFVKKINEALDSARALPQYRRLSRDFLAIRVHSDESETKHILSMCDRRRLATQCQNLPDNEEAQRLAEIAAIQQVFPGYNPEEEGHNGKSSRSQEIDERRDGSDTSELEPQSASREPRGAIKAQENAAAISSVRQAISKKHIEAYAKNTLLASDNASASHDIVDAVNSQRTLPEHGVQDAWCHESLHGLAHHTWDYARKHSKEPVFVDFIEHCSDYIRRGTSMSRKDVKARDDAIAAAVAEVKKRTVVQGMTATNTGLSGNKFSSKVLLLVDEAGMMTVSEFCMLVAHMNVDECLLFGDENQLSPQVPSIQPVGCTRESGVSILEYFSKNHWIASTLNLQRRSAPGMMRIPGILVYNDLIQDAPSTSEDPDRLALAKDIRDWLNQRFPDQSSDQFFRYILIHSQGEVRDELTGSYFNLQTAAVIINLQEEMVNAGVLPALSNITLTRHRAQQRIHDHAIAQSALDSKDLGLEDIRNYTPEEYQGDEGPLIWGDSVRTISPGSTSDLGRDVVLTTRAQSGFINVADVFGLGDANDPPFMKRAFEEAEKLGACVYIDPQGPDAGLLTHRHIHLGTENDKMVID